MNKKFSFFLLVIKLKSSQERAVFQSRAGSCGGGVPVATTGGVELLQQKINSAKNGDTINLESGTYMGPNALSLGLGGAIFISASRGGSDTCMIRIENKTLTLKGQGSGATVIYGEGHAKPYQDPYQNRGGICLINSKVTIDGVTIKEFQKRAMVVYNSTVIIKNSIIEGSDEGGISLLGNSSGLFVNNYFVAFNFGGVMLWQNSQAKIVNNIFHDAAVMFFYHPGTNDQAHAEIINNVFSGTGREPIKQVDWWPQETSKIKNNILSYNFFEKREAACNTGLEYCEEFPGKQVGDPKIPGPKILGVAGGPCTDPNSSICSSFIASNLPKPIVEVTPDPQQNSQNTIKNTKEVSSSITNSRKPIIPLLESRNNKPKETRQPHIINNQVFSNKQEILFIKNIGANKTLRIFGMYINNAVQLLQKELKSGQDLEYSYKDFCKNQNLHINGAVLYSSTEDQYKTIRYKNLELDCSKSMIFSIE